jgi:hypothetical protein
MVDRVRSWSRMILALAGAAVAACGGGGSSRPTTPAIPVATPLPAPTPAPSPAAFVCPLPPSSSPTTDCPKLKPLLGDQVNRAIDAVLTSRPELFNFNDMAGGNPKVLDRQKYHEAVKAELEAQGVCTLIEKEELALKVTNEYNEQWNIWSSSAYVMRRYVTTCSPAWF